MNFKSLKKLTSRNKELKFRFDFLNVPKIIFGYTFCLFFFHACSSETPKQQKKPLPNTPETVCKAWQDHLDSNEIEKAALLSTPNTRKWLEENKAIFLNDDQFYATNFLTMSCVEKAEKAICTYMIEEEGERIEDYFLLVKKDGQWLVDIEEDESVNELDEQIFREMQKELNLSQ